jgi:hypothetical protein
MSVEEDFEAGRDHSVTKALQNTADKYSSKETAEPLNTCIYGHHVTCYNIYSPHPSLISTTLGTYLSRIMIDSLMMAF